MQSRAGASQYPVMGTNCSICVSPVSRLLNVKVKVTQSCPTLCDPINYTVHGILQAMGFSREYWSGLSFPFSRGSSQPRSPTLHADSLPTEPPGKPNSIRIKTIFHQKCLLCPLQAVPKFTREHFSIIKDQFCLRISGITQYVFICIWILSLA